MQPDIKIAPSNLKEVATLLNSLLADESVLYTKTRNAHWNIEGPNFSELHTLFEKQYQQLEALIDDLAERIRMLGHYAIGSLKGFLTVTHLLESDDDFGNQKKVIQSLLNDHETIIGVIRKDIAPVSEKYKDLGTMDFITGLMEKHEKMAWMLRASIS